MCIPMFIAALFTVAKIWKQHKVSIDRWMDKEDVIYIYGMEYYSALKKEWKVAICNNTDGPGGYYT